MKCKHENTKVFDTKEFLNGFDTEICLDCTRSRKIGICSFKGEIYKLDWKNRKLGKNLEDKKKRIDNFIEDLQSELVKATMENLIKTEEKPGIDRNTYKIFFSKDDNLYKGLCFQHPGCRSFGKTQEEALEGIKKAIPDEFGGVDYNEYIVEWSDLDKKYIGKCLKYKNLGYVAPTQEEALEGIKKLILENV